LRIYYLALGFVIEALEERFDTAGNSDKTLLDATRKLTHYGFVLTDVWTGRMSDEYERARERWVHGAEELRREMITSVLAGHDVDTDAASKVLAYELRRHHLGAVLWVPPGDDQGATMLRLQTAAADIAAEVGPGRALILPQSPTRIWAWVGMSSTPADGAVEGLATRRRTDGVSVAVGEPDYGIAGFTRTHNDAADAAGVAALANFAAGRVTLYRSVRVAALFARDPDRTRRFVRGQLGSLAADDDESARLRATLMVYLEERGSRVATAERLGIHPNTVANRVRASRALLAHDLAESRVELRIALRLALALGSSVLDAAPVAR
jgi:DNA-binding PucR family transcriptional regulator